MVKTYTAHEAAAALGIDVSRVQKLCRAKRLGYTLPKHGSAWVITDAEIAWHREYGTLPAGRPKKKTATPGESEQSEKS